MRRFTLLLILTLLVTSLSSSIDKHLEDTSGLFSVQINGKWGFIDRQGRLVIEPRFDEVGFFSDGLATVRMGAKWGFIDTSGDLRIPARFQYAEFFSEGLAVAAEGERFGYIDKTGVWSIPAEFDTANPFRQDRALVQKMGRYGFIGKDGQFLFLAEYEEGFDFNEGLAAVRYADKWGFIDTSGNYIIQPTLDDAYEFSEGWAQVSIKDFPNFINRKGDLMIPDLEHALFLDAQNFSEGLAVAQSLENGKYGYIDKTGTFIIAPRYDLVFLFHEGMAAVSQSGRYGFIDKSGNEAIPLKYKFAHVFIGGLARVKSGDDWIYIDRKGSTVWPRKRVDRTQKSHHLADIVIHYDNAGLTQVIIKDGKLSYIDSEYTGKEPHAAGNPDDYLRRGSDRPIKTQEIQKLIQIIQNSGFLNLADTYGTPDPLDRHYPIRISIKTLDIDKSVLFRSHPDYEAPQAFKQVEQALLNLARRKRK